MSYRVWVNGKTNITEAVQVGSMSLSDALDEIAMRFKFTASIIPGLPNLMPPTPISLTETQANGTAKVIFDGVTWDVTDSRKGSHSVSVTAYERIKYMAESEDEYLFNAGMTASSVIKKIASDWGISIGSIANTKVALAKQRYSGGKNLYSIMRDALVETVDKGGGMFVLRMAQGKLDLIPLGSSNYTLSLDAMESASHNLTLDGMVTKVKVLGNDESETKLAPVLAIVTGNTSKYGTIQKIYSDSQVKTASQAKTAGQKKLSGPIDTYTYDGIDINTIRAGDKVKFDGKDLIVTSVEHEIGDPGHMTMDMSPAEIVKVKYYGE